MPSGGVGRLQRKGQRSSVRVMPRRPNSPREPSLSAELFRVPSGASRPMRLAATSDASCTQCHANLRANGASPHVVNSVTRFDGGHPEFAALRPGSSDPGTIKLNHAIHLRHDLKGPGGPVQLDCSDCHRTSGASEPWKFGSATPASAPGNAPAKANDIPPSKQMGRANMAPIAYAKHCSACHGLRFDSRFPDQVPHDTPAVIHAFVLQKFQQYIPSHPSELRVPARDRNLPQQSVPASRVLTSQEWVTMRVAESEELLWRKTCSECHSVTFAPNASLPSIAKSNIAPRWFAHAVFDHDAHKFLKCVECHAGAPTSQSTAEVLLPGIQTCEKCHHHGAESAESRCFECHTYHDWTKEKPVKGKFIFRASVAKTGNAGLQ